MRFSASVVCWGCVWVWERRGERGGNYRAHTLQKAAGREIMRPLHHMLWWTAAAPWASLRSRGLGAARFPRGRMARTPRGRGTSRATCALCKALQVLPPRNLLSSCATRALPAWLWHRERGARWCALARDATELMQVGELARRHKLCICLPYVERGDAASLFNSVAIFQPQDGRLAHNYQKVHLAGRAERALFSRGMPDGLRPCHIEFASGARVSLGVAVCYDLEFPELSRCLAVQGAEVLIAPTAVDELATTPRFIPARAMENQMFVLHANPEGRHRRRCLTMSSRVAVASMLPTGRRS